MSDETKPCTNGFCWLRCEPITGQHTNGPCNCLRDVPLPLQQAIKRKIASQREEIANLTAESRQLASRLDAGQDHGRAGGGAVDRRGGAAAILKGQVGVPLAGNGS